MINAETAKIRLGYWNRGNDLLLAQRAKLLSFEPRRPKSLDILVVRIVQFSGYSLARLLSN